MADFTVGTPVPVSGYEGMVRAGITGEASITAKEWLYLDTTTNTLKKALNDSQAHAAVVGMALTTQATSGGPIQYMPSGGEVTVTGFTEGVPVFLSSTAGACHPIADLASTEFYTYLGEGTSAVFRINIHATADQVA